MGTKMDRIYACPFMGHFEHKGLESYRGSIPPLYRRYTDGGIGVISMPEKDLDNFISFLKNSNPMFSFTYHVSITSVNFVDIAVIIGRPGYFTSVYQPSGDPTADVSMQEVRLFFFFF